MIISHQHKFIFFAVPRTGTHTLRQALYPYLGENDWEQQALFRQTKIPIDSIAQIGHGHISWQQLKKHLPKEQWQSYFKFAIVRNPYDRYVSVCTFLNRHNPEFKNSAVQFMKNALKQPRFQQRILVQPQFNMLSDELGESGMDFVGRYEDLQKSIDTIFNKIGIPRQALPHANASTHNAYMDYYDDELCNLVANHYQSDFELFDYPL